MTKYTYGQLQNLWIQAGGSPLAAPMAAAIAMAESGGNSDASHTNTDGSTDRGLWQINSVHGALSVLDPMGNARAAVQISNNGSTWRPWCTAWSTGLCSGTYLGDGAPYKQYLNGSTTPVGSDMALEPTAFTNPLSPDTWARAFLAPIFQTAWFAGMSILGIVLMVLAIVYITKSYRMSISVFKWDGKILKTVFGIVGPTKGEMKNKARNTVRGDS